jgi:hypothetical protein
MPGSHIAVRIETSTTPGGVERAHIAALEPEDEATTTGRAYTDPAVLEIKE